MKHEEDFIKKNQEVMDILVNSVGPANDWVEEEIVTLIRAAIEKIPNPVIDKYVIDNSDGLVGLLQNKVNDVEALMVNIDEIGNWEPLWAEQDLTMIQIHHNKWWKSGKENMDPALWAEHIIKIFAWLDCTGCCNAIEYVKVGQFATLIKINSSITFHS